VHKPHRPAHLAKVARPEHEIGDNAQHLKRAGRAQDDRLKSDEPDESDRPRISAAIIVRDGQVVGLLGHGVPCSAGYLTRIKLARQLACRRRQQAVGMAVLIRVRFLGP
jgi:hypothetical protein